VLCLTPMKSREWAHYLLVRPLLDEVRQLMEHARIVPKNDDRLFCLVDELRDSLAGALDAEHRSECGFAVARVAALRRKRHPCSGPDRTVQSSLPE